MTVLPDNFHLHKEIQINIKLWRNQENYNQCLGDLQHTGLPLKLAWSPNGCTGHLKCF